MLESKHPHATPDLQTTLEEVTSELNCSVPGSRGIGRAFESIWTRLSPYLPADLVFEFLNSPTTKKQNLTVLSADIRGFTSLAEQFDPEDCICMLNEYFDLAVDLVFDFHGQVDKFQGDGFMAIFTGICDGETHERRGVRCARRLRELARDLDLPKLPGKRIPLGIGINTGIAAVGNLGSKRRSDYTAIGDVVNVAHYLQRISEPDQIIVSEQTQRGMGDDLECETLGYVRVKRRINRVEAFLID